MSRQCPKPTSTLGNWLIVKLFCDLPNYYCDDDDDDDVALNDKQMPYEEDTEVQDKKILCTDATVPDDSVASKESIKVCDSSTAVEEEIHDEAEYSSIGKDDDEPVLNDREVPDEVEVEDKKKLYTDATFPDDNVASKESIKDSDGSSAQEKEIHDQVENSSIAKDDDEPVLNDREVSDEVEVEDKKKLYTDATFPDDNVASKESIKDSDSSSAQEKEIHGQVENSSIAKDDDEPVLNDREVPDEVEVEDKKKLYTDATFPDDNVASKESIKDSDSSSAQEKEIHGQVENSSIAKDDDEPVLNDREVPVEVEVEDKKNYRMRAWIIYFGFLIFLLTGGSVYGSPVHGSPQHGYLLGPCNEAQFFNQNGTCSDCPPGTYMDQVGHQNTNCSRCKKEDLSLHIVVKENCTSKSDAVLKCEDGYYNYIKDPHVLLCDRILNPGEQIQRTTTTPHENTTDKIKEIKNREPRGWTPPPDTSVIPWVAFIASIALPILVLALGFY